MAFKDVPVWRRALTAIFMCRWLTDKPGNKQWKNFCEQDYKINVRLFRRYVKHDERIMMLCSDLNNLPETDPVHERRLEKRRLATVDSTSEPPTTKYKVVSDSDDDSA